MVLEAIRENPELREQADFEFQDNYLPQLELSDLQVVGKKVVNSAAILLDQYATLCDLLISSVGDSILRIVDFFNTIPSFMEVLSAIFYHLPHFILSVIWTIIYSCFYIITLPARIFIYLLFNQPLIFFITPLILMLFVIVGIAMLKRVPVISVCRRGWHYIAPYIWTIAYSVLIYLFPPLGAAVSAVKLALTPVTALFDFISMLFYQLAPLRSLSRKAQRDRDARLQERESTPSLTDGQTPSERILCCVCFNKVKSVLLRPCNHVCVCSDCAVVLLAEPVPHCPLCRAVVESQCDVYI